MEFSYTTDQKLIKKAAREFLMKECPSELVRAMEQDEKRFSPELWRKIAQLGWLGLLLPEEYDGSGPNFLDATVLLEEMGRYLVPLPFLPTVILGGIPILCGDSEEMKKKVLPKIANGELILTMALTEIEPVYAASGIKIRAIRDGNHFIIEGTKLFVPYAHVAHYLVCAVRTGKSSKNEDGVTLFLIEGKNSKINYTLLETMAGEALCEVVFNRVPVNEQDIIGTYNQGWEIVEKSLAQAAVAQCAFMLGGAERVLEMAVRHAKDRVQFRRPIGSFQAIQHRCANMKVDLETARFATYEAAWKINQGYPYTLEASVAKAWVSQAYNRICLNGHQILGGGGVMRDYDMELYSRRAKAAEAFLGDSHFHSQIIAKQIGL